MGAGAHPGGTAVYASLNEMDRPAADRHQSPVSRRPPEEWQRGKIPRIGGRAGRADLEQDCTRPIL